MWRPSGELVSIVLRVLWQGALAGVVATLVMDVGGGILRKLGLASVPPASMGRWFGYIGRGQLVHDDIARAAPLSYEMPLALAAHYLIGIGLGTLFVAWMAIVPARGAWLFGVAVAYGLATSLFAWFVMFPMMGYGPLGLSGPPGTSLPLASTLNHILFGLGLGGIALALR